MVRRELLKAMLLSAAGCLLPVSVLDADVPTRVLNMRLWTGPEHTRIVFDLDKTVQYSLVQPARPDQIIVEMARIQWKVDPAALLVRDSMIKDVQWSHHGPDLVQLVFSLTKSATSSAFQLKAIGEKSPRLVIELQHGSAARDDEVQATLVAYNKKRTPVIVIDPGHGGEDPGAVGLGGTYEKTVTLEVAKRLVLALADSGYKAHLTRTDDYFVSLRKRVSIARQHGADLFVSLHADAFRIASARGASVYCLSEAGRPEPDRALRMLVERENSADLIGGVDLGEVADPELRDILMDLSQRDARNRAITYGSNLLSSLKKVPSLRLHYRGVKQAGFAVLKAPDIPSVLVEMAFLSNRDEEIQLRKEKHQEALVEALTNGTRAFFRSASLA